MRLERLTYNKIKIFITTDDLLERGLSKEDIWKDSLKWHQLFQEMLEEASEEFGIDFLGSVAIEIFSMQAQGMIMIVTVDDEKDEEFLTDSFLDIGVSSQKSEEILFEFADFEDCLGLSKRLAANSFSGGSLYRMNEKYYLYMKGDLLYDTAKLIANMAEYGCASLESIHNLSEYGKLIMEENAIETLVHYF